MDPAMSRLSKHDLIEELHRIVRQELRLDERFTVTSNLQDSGLDSLALTRLLLAVEERLGVWIDESLLTPDNLENVESLATCVHELLGE
jgi:acyl carrier protein